MSRTVDPLAAESITPELRQARIADSAAFAIQAMLLVALLTSLPSLLPILGISASQIALVVLALSAVAAVGSLTITFVAERTSSAKAIRIALGLLFIASFGLTFGPLSPESARMPVFAICTMFYGFSVGALDATTNMQAVAIQRRYGRIILSSFHACWSLGAILGSLIVSFGQWVADLAGYGPTPEGVPDPHLYDRYMWTMLAVIAILAIVILSIQGKMLKYGQKEEKSVATEESKKFHPPMKVFAALCVAMVFFYTIDFGIQNWSSIFLTDIDHATAKVAPLGVAAYTVLGMIARLLADRAARRFGESRTLLAAAIISFLGMLLVTFATVPWLAIIGFAIVGCGVPITAPLCFSTAGYLVPLEQMDEAIGRLNLFNYLGTILGGGVVGYLTHGNMRIVMLVPVVMCVLLMVLSPFFRRPANLAAVEEGAEAEVDVSLMSSK